MYVHLLHNGMNRLMGWCDVARVTIDMLPHVALLKIFDFYVDEAWIEEWYTLVHVCQKWRNIVFGSPRRLDLRLYCTAGTPMREMLDVWPLLPIIVWSDGHENWGMDNIIAALGHRDRICRINLWRIPSSYFENVLAAMERPFPELTRLLLGFEDEVALVDPDLFLGVLYNVCKPSGWIASRFLDYQNCFCLLPNLFVLIFGEFLIPGTFHPRQWPLASPC